MPWLRREDVGFQRYRALHGGGSEVDAAVGQSAGPSAIRGCVHCWWSDASAAKMGLGRSSAALRGSGASVFEDVE
jgi:hypothetical protein